MSNLFVTSDLHLGHANIIKYSRRPFSSVDDMNERLVENWNSVVKDGDTVWSLGDFAFMPFDKTLEILKRLNGNINLVLGNHCQKIQANRKMLLESGLVKEMRDYKELSWDKQKMVLFHYAQRTWNGSHYGAWQLFGHTHGTMEPYGKSVDVGVDSPYILGTPVYRPFSFEEIRDFMRDREVIKDFG